MNRLTLLLSALVVMDMAAPLYAELIAYEGFDYVDVGSDLRGKDGGIGFGRAWVSSLGIPADRIDISEGSLTFPGLKTEGNGVGSLEPLFPNCEAAARGLNTRISREETTTKYLSGLVRPEGVLGRGPFRGIMFIALDGSSDDIAAAGPGREPDYFIERFGDEQTGPRSDVVAASGETALLVIKAELQPGNDTFTLYVNPTPGAPEPSVGTVFDGVDIGNLNGINLVGCGAFSIDELRFGDTFADVTPVEQAVGQEFKIVVPNRFAEAEGNQEGGTAFGFPIKSQEVFLASEFDALPASYRWITGVALRPDENALLPRSTEYGDAQYRLSTTTKEPDELTDVFAENVGPDETVVFDRSPFTISARDIPDLGERGPRDFDYVYEFDTPFFYDPTTGRNLLIEFRSKSGYVNEGPQFDVHNESSGIFAADVNAMEATSRIDSLVREFTFAPFLQAGDSDQDLDFDQLDLVQVQIAGKYLSGEPASWGEGDWDGAPGGFPGKPPEGDGMFNQLDIVAAQQAAVYLTGSYAADTFVPVPEPGSFVLLAAGLLALGASVCGRRVNRRFLGIS